MNEHRMAGCNLLRGRTGSESNIKQETPRKPTLLKDEGRGLNLHPSSTGREVAGAGKCLCWEIRRLSLSLLSACHMPVLR